MARLGYMGEKEIPLKILHALWGALSEGHGLTWTEIAKLTKGIASDTLSNYLKDMESIRMISHEGNLYTLNEKYLAWFVPELDSSWSTEELSALIKLRFQEAYSEYIRLLQTLVKARSRTAAHEFFETAFTFTIELPLLAVARLVWDNRESLKAEALRVIS